MGTHIGWVGSPTAEAVWWLRPYPYPYAGAPGQPGWLSARYPYLLRILHPAEYYDPELNTTAPVTWSAIAAARGVSLDEGAGLQEVSGDGSPDPSLDGVFDHVRHSGTVPPDLQDPLYEHLPDARHGLMWEGWGDHGNNEAVWRTMATTGTALRGGRGELGYFPVTAIDPRMTSAITSRTPSFWWGADRTWLVASGIDEHDTLVASTSWALLDRIHHDDSIETQLYTRA